MSAVKRQVRRLERHRAKVKGKRTPEAQGRGQENKRLALKVNLGTALAQKKNSGKAAREFESMDLAQLQTQLISTRKELFNMRFKLATGQLENVAGLSAAKRRIARILTLIKQKEVGA